MASLNLKADGKGDQNRKRSRRHRQPKEQSNSSTVQAKVTPPGNDIVLTSLPLDIIREYNVITPDGQHHHQSSGTSSIPAPIKKRVPVEPEQDLGIDLGLNSNLSTWQPPQDMSIYSTLMKRASQSRKNPGLLPKVWKQLAFDCI
jgi:hypothetical protein